MKINTILRFASVVLIALMILPVIGIHSGFVQATIPDISYGDRVAVTWDGDGVAVRSCASTSCDPPICRMPAGFEGEVKGGPQYNGGYKWWYIEWVNGSLGWTAEASLAGTSYVQSLPGYGTYPSVTNSGLSYCVRVYDDLGTVGLSVRTGPGLGYDRITRQYPGERGWTTGDGPYVSTSEGLVWWHIDWNDGWEGWSADSRANIEAGVYLVKEDSRYLDTTLPNISISYPSNGQDFTTSSITVSGGASDNVAVSKVEVKVGSGSWVLASGTTSWSKGVTLNPGSNTIYAKATDTSGNTKETSVTVTYSSSCWSTNPLSNAELADLVTRYFPDGVVPQTGENIRVTAYAVARAESDGNPSACGDNGQSIGVWQIHMLSHPQYDKECLFDPECNAKAARAISNDGQNWNPWCTWERSACNGNGNEAYKAYLAEAKVALGSSSTPTTPEKTETGFFYPTGDSGPYRYAGWLAKGCDEYLCGYYHLGTDMEADAGDSVYAIADGDIVYVSVNGWGDGNYGLLIRHKLNTGEDFLALYGHVRPLSDDLRFTASGPVSPSVRVTAGQAFATVGPYDSTPHLHFGIRPGTQIPPSPWGKMPLDRWPATNGFVDPEGWITAKTWDIAKIGSPGELRVYDSQGRVTGMVNDEARVEIPNSSYSYNEETVIIWSSSESYQYSIVGTDEGSYALTLTQVREETSEFTVTKFDTSTGAVHEYTVDWNALSQGEEDAVTLYIDYDGDGVVDEIRSMGGRSNLPCAIATAAYGTPMAEELEILRKFRDEYLLTDAVGQVLVELYYKISPPIAKFITEHPSLKPIVRAGLVPAVGVSKVIMNSTQAQKAAIVILFVLVSVALAAWVRKRRGSRSKYIRA